MYASDNTTKNVTVRLAARAFKGWERRSQWQVSLGGMTETAGTATAAAEALAARITRTIERADLPHVVVMFGGYVSISTANADGWIENIYTPDGTRSMSGRGDDDVFTVKARARYGLAQRVTDWTDDDSVRTGAAFCLEHDGTELGNSTRAAFLEYAAWQRAAAQAIADGRDDWHEWATRNAADFEVKEVIA